MRVAFAGGRSFHGHPSRNHVISVDDVRALCGYIPKGSVGWITTDGEPDCPECKKILASSKGKEVI